VFYFRDWEFPCLSKLSHWKYSTQARNTYFFFECIRVTVFYSIYSSLHYLQIGYEMHILFKHTDSFPISWQGHFEPFSLFKDSVSPPKKICTLVQRSAETKLLRAIFISAPKRESKVESAQSIFLDFHFCAVFPHLFLPIRSELNLNALASVSGRKRFIAKERT